MNSTTEDATSNKRRRSGTATASNRSNAASGGAAAAAVPNLSALGPRLEPLKVMLESQPEELKGTIISLSKEMLDLRATIKQREESYARFTKPSLHPTTGEIINDEAGNPLPFIPNSLRIKRENCPVKPTSAMASEQSMRNQMEQVYAVHDAYILKMAAHAKAVAELEISLRQDKLRRSFYDLLSKIALAHNVAEEVTAGKLPDGIMLSRDERMRKVVFDTLRDAPANICNAIGLVNGADLSLNYAASINFINPVIKDKMNEADSEFIKPIITKMHTWLPILSVSLWEADDARDNACKVNAAIRIALKPQEMTQANDDVNMQLDAEDEQGTSQRLIDTIRHEAKEEAKKMVSSLMRKNYSGGTKNQEPRPTKNGRESKNTSSAGKHGKTDANRKAKNKDKQSNGKDPKQQKNRQQDKEADATKGSRRNPKNNRHRNNQGG
eukprot:scaffold8576_cov44-Cyclotella_meneghiniana.AAC.1